MEQKRKDYQEETGSDPLHLPDRTKHTYKTGDKDQVLESDVHGNPNLVYDSKFNEGWEPSGVPVWNFSIKLIREYFTDNYCHARTPLRSRGAQVLRPRRQRQIIEIKTTLLNHFT